MSKRKWLSKWNGIEVPANWNGMKNESCQSEMFEGKQRRRESSRNPKQYYFLGLGVSCESHASLRLGMASWESFENFHFGRCSTVCRVLSDDIECMLCCAGVRPEQCIINEYGWCTFSKCICRLRCRVSTSQPSSAFKNAFALTLPCWCRGFPFASGFLSRATFHRVQKKNSCF